MKNKFLLAFAASFAVIAAPAFAQEDAAAPAGLAEDQAIELARIVNAAGDDTKEAIATAVKDVLGNAEDAAASGAALSGNKIARLRPEKAVWKDFRTGVRFSPPPP